MEFYFERPLVFLTLFLLPFIGWIVYSGMRKRREGLERFWLRGVDVIQYRLLQPAFTITGMVLLIVAIADPLVGTEEVTVGERSVDVVIAIDGSRSMDAVVDSKTRFQIAKDSVSHLLEILNGTRVGLLLFSDSAITISPLTKDERAVGEFLKRIDLGVMKGGGTDIGEAVRLSMEMMKDTERERVVVLFTDGGEGGYIYDPYVQRAVDEGVRIYTVGVGPPKPLPVPIRSEEGLIIGYRTTPTGKRIFTRLREDELKRIARITGAGYYNVTYRNIDLTGLADAITSLGRMEKLPERATHYSRWFRVFLILSILFLIPGSVTPLGVVRKEHLKGYPRPRTGGFLHVASLFLLVWLVTTGMGERMRYNQEFADGIRFYREGRYEEAVRSFRNASRLKPDDTSALFNLGLSLYMAGYLDEAGNAFERVISLDDRTLLSDAYYDLGCVLFRESKLNKAVIAYKKALFINPDDQDARHNLEVCLNVLRMAVDSPPAGLGEPTAPLSGEGGENLEMFFRREVKIDEKERIRRRFVESFGEVDAEGVEIFSHLRAKQYTEEEARFVLDKAEEAEREMYIKTLRKKIPPSRTTLMDW